MTWITITEAAKLVRRSPRSIYNWIDSGRLTTRLSVEGNRLLVNGAQLLDVEPTVRPGRPRGSASSRHARDE